LDGQVIVGRRPGVPNVIFVARTEGQVIEGLALLKKSQIAAFNVDVEAGHIDEKIIEANKNEGSGRPIGRTINDHFA
jgi:hypothetical protein